MGSISETDVPKAGGDGENQDEQVKQYKSAVQKTSGRKSGYATMSGLPLDSIYLPEEPNAAYYEQQGMP